MFRSTIAAACATAALSAAPALAQAMSPAAYVSKAAASDTYEMQSSKLLLTSTHDAKLRDFANRMIADHTSSTNDVKMAAMRAHVHGPMPHLDAMGSANMAKLRAAHGAARDRLYVQQQQGAHQMALQLHQGYADGGTAEPLKMAAAKIAPVVQSHIDMLNGMGTMGGMHSGM